MIEAIELWLSWDAENSRMTEQLYRLGPGHPQLEDNLDQLEQLRLRAITISKEILQNHQSA